MLEVRLRSRIAPEEMEQKVGKILTPDDMNLIITRDTKVYKPNGDLLLIYRRKAIPDELNAASYPILTTIRQISNNRGLASGSRRVKIREQTYAAPVASTIVGSFDPQGGRFPYCRLTAWTGKHTEEFSELYPFFQQVAGLFSLNVPDRYAVQARRAEQTADDWVIPGTPFTTVTVNNTYATGVHKDAGDLNEGFSCLVTLRRGDYDGGILCFPEFRVGVDLRDGDAIFMDAHEWHGNTEIIKKSEDAERISIVLYYRSEILSCGTMAEELEKAKRANKGSAILEEDV